MPSNMKIANFSDLEDLQIPVGVVQKLPLWNAKNAHSIALAASIVIPTGVRLFGFSVMNTGAAQYLQIHDYNALPSNGNIPEQPYYMAAASNFSVDFGPNGRMFQNGIVICNSSTIITLTINAADCWFDVQYEVE